MSRASKTDPSSGQGARSSQGAENEEAALLALLRRLGLALSPQQAASNRPQGLQGDSGGSGCGNSDSNTTGQGNDNSADMIEGERASENSPSPSVSQYESRLSSNRSPKNGGTVVGSRGGPSQGAGEIVGTVATPEPSRQSQQPSEQYEQQQAAQQATCVGQQDSGVPSLENRHPEPNENEQISSAAASPPEDPEENASPPAGRLEPSGTEDAGDADGGRSSRECMVDLMRREITAKEAVLLGPLLWAATGVNCLKLCYNHLKDGGAEAVSLAMRRHPSLHTMDLGFNGIADQGATSLARSLSSNRSLRTLYLSGNSIGPTGARALAESLATNAGLTTLHLTGNCIGPDGASALADVLRSNTSLTRLFVGGAGIKARGACAMASALVTNTVLSDLYMSDNEIGDEGVEGLAHALRQNTSLKLLELCFNRITAVGAESFSKAAWGAAGLRSLRLDNNQMGDRGARALALALPTLALETLELGFNNIQAAGVAALMQAVVSSPTLTSLSLSGNALDAEAAKTIQAALAQPRCALWHLSLDHTSLGRASESFIATGVLSNRRLALHTLTGFRLGAAFARLGMPQQVDQFSNDQALEQVRLYWANHGHAVSGGGVRVPATSVSSSQRPSPSPQRIGAGGVGSSVPTAGTGVPAVPGRTLPEGHGSSVSRREEQYHLQQNSRAQTGAQAGTSDACATGTTSFGGQAQERVVASAESRAAEGEAGVTGTGRRGQVREEGVVPAHKHAGSGAPPAAAPIHRAVWGEGPAEEPVRSAKMKSCRVVAGPNVVNTKGRGGKGGLESGDTSEAEGARKKASVRGTRGAVVEALHQIAQLPFNAAELWSLHQYYFSPAPEPPLAPVEGGDSAPSPSDAHKASRAGAVGKAGVTPGGKDRGGYVSSGWSEVIPGASPRKAVERDVGTHVDGPGGLYQDTATPGAGDRRSRRSSSIGGEDDDEDPDSPLPPSKRYRNGCTKTRIACFPLVQDRIRMLKTKPDERGVLTLLRQLRFLQLGGCEASGSLSPEARIAMADPCLAGASGTDCGSGAVKERVTSPWVGGNESGPPSGLAYLGGKRSVLTEQEIESLLLEEL